MITFEEVLIEDAQMEGYFKGEKEGSRKARREAKERQGKMKSSDSLKFSILGSADIRSCRSIFNVGQKNTCNYKSRENIKQSSN